VGQVALEADDLGAEMNAVWKFLSSRPLWIALAALFGWLFSQEWLSHRITARAQASSYTTVDTRESVKWERVKASCPEAGGPVQVVSKISKAEVERLAREYGLILTERVEVPGGTVEVPVFVREGKRFRLLGEKEIGVLAWGGKGLGTLDEEGAFGLDAKPYPEPFNEKLSQWVVSGTFGYGWSEQAQASAPVVGLSGEFVWRRFGRWEIGPTASATYGFGGIGGEALIALKVSRRDLPLRLRAVSP